MLKAYLIVIIKNVLKTGSKDSLIYLRGSRMNYVGCVVLRVRVNVAVTP